MKADNLVILPQIELFKESVGLGVNCFGPLDVLLKVQVFGKNWKCARSTGECQDWKDFGTVLDGPSFLVLFECQVVAERTEKLVSVEVDSKLVPVRSERVAFFGRAGAITAWSVTKNYK